MPRTLVLPAPVFKRTLPARQTSGWLFKVAAAQSSSRASAWLQRTPLQPKELARGVAGVPAPPRPPARPYAAVPMLRTLPGQLPGWCSGANAGARLGRRAWHSTLRQRAHPCGPPGECRNRGHHRHPVRRGRRGRTTGSHQGACRHRSAGRRTGWDGRIRPWTPCPKSSA